MRSAQLSAALVAAAGLLGACSASSDRDIGGQPETGGASFGGSGESGGGSSASIGDAGWNTPGGGSMGGAGSGGAAGSQSPNGGAAGVPGNGGAGAGTDACTNSADFAIVSSMDVGSIVGSCGQQNLASEPGTRNCIAQQTGLSAPCVTCFDNTVQCIAQQCLQQCISGPSSAGCVSCRQQHCDPAFAACSGLTPT